MRFDPWKLGYTVHDDGLHVHYPQRAADGSLTYGAGFAFDHRPEMQCNPDGERAKLWRELLGLDA